MKKFDPSNRNVSRGKVDFEEISAIMRFMLFAGQQGQNFVLKDVNVKNGAGDYDFLLEGRPGEQLAVEATSLVPDRKSFGTDKQLEIIAKKIEIALNAHEKRLLHAYHIEHLGDINAKERTAILTLIEDKPSLKKIKALKHRSSLELGAGVFIKAGLIRGKSHFVSVPRSGQWAGTEKEWTNIISEMKRVIEKKDASFKGLSSDIKKKLIVIVNEAVVMPDESEFAERVKRGGVRLHHSDYLVFFWDWGMPIVFNSKLKTVEPALFLIQ